MLVFSHGDEKKGTMQTKRRTDAEECVKKKEMVLKKRMVTEQEEEEKKKKTPKHITCWDIFLFKYFNCLQKTKSNMQQWKD